MALTKDGIIDKLVEDRGLNRREAVDLVDTFFDDIKNRVSKGERVRLSGFGAFELSKKYYQRKRRDIPADENTPDWIIPGFEPYAKLAARIQKSLREAD